MNPEISQALFILGCAAGSGIILGLLSKWFVDALIDYSNRREKRMEEEAVERHRQDLKNMEYIRLNATARLPRKVND